MDTQLGILQQTGIAGRQIIARLPPLMRRDGAKAPDQIGKRDLQRGPDVIFLTGKPDIARPKTTICPIIPQGKVKVLSLRTRKYALQAIIVIVFLRICSLAGSLLTIAG